MDHMALYETPTKGHAMKLFKKFAENHEINIRLRDVQEPNAVTPQMGVPKTDPHEIAEIIDETVKRTAITVGITIGALIIVSTVAEIVKSAFTENDKD